MADGARHVTGPQRLSTSPFEHRPTIESDPTQGLVSRSPSQGELRSSLFTGLPLRQSASKGSRTKFPRFAEWITPSPAPWGRKTGTSCLSAERASASNSRFLAMTRRFEEAPIHRQGVDLGEREFFGVGRFQGIDDHAFRVRSAIGHGFSEVFIDQPGPLGTVNRNAPRTSSISRTRSSYMAEPGMAEYRVI